MTLVPWVHFHVVDHIMLFQLDSHRLAYLLAESHQARDVLQDAEGGLFDPDGVQHCLAGSPRFHAGL